MTHRLKILGIILAVFGVGGVLTGIYAYTQVNAGQKSLEAFSAAQDIELNYDENGNLTDRGTTEGADAIKKLLTDDWDYAVKNSELDPNDPLVDTPSEYMYQMATIAYHVLHGTQTVVLQEDKEFNGEVFPAGEYEFDVEGRYWTDFNRQHPIEGPAREQAWTGTAHALIANLGVGAVTASALQLGLAISLLNIVLGAGFVVLGLGLIWVTNGQPGPVTFSS